MRQTFVFPAVYEPGIPEIERPQTYALDHTGTGIGVTVIMDKNIQDLTVYYVCMYIYMYVYIYIHIYAVVK
jgi:hypothetical protein